MKLTATDKKVLKRALEDVLEDWSRKSANLGVIERAPDGAWALSPETAKRKKGALDNRRRALLMTAKKLGIEFEDQEYFARGLDCANEKPAASVSQRRA